MKISVGSKEYNVKIAKTDEEKAKGLQGVTSLPENEGMLFDYSDNILDVDFWMKDTEIPLDIIFISDDDEVISVKQGQPLSEEFISESDVAYVLEVNANSDIVPGDEFEILDKDESDETLMQVLAPDGSTLMELEGGERIVSRKETLTLIRKAKRAYKSKSDKDYKALGKYIFKVLDKQDNREPEYVKSPN